MYIGVGYYIIVHVLATGTILVCDVARCLQFRRFYLVDEVNRDGYRHQIVTMLHSMMMWVCLCIHRSCSTVMAHARKLLCIPVSELVSCNISTIPICPFLIFHL